MASNELSGDALSKRGVLAIALSRSISLAIASICSGHADEGELTILGLQLGPQHTSN